MHEPDDLREPDTLRDGLLALAAETCPSHPLPSAGELWWKAEIRRRLVEEKDEEERAARPALWGQAAGLAVGTAALIVFLSLQMAGFLGTGGMPILPIVGLFTAAPVAGLLAVGLMRR